jgi:hypothetical protein
MTEERILTESDLPYFCRRDDNKLIRVRDYTKAQEDEPETTLIKVANCLGGWTYELGTTQEEAELNREIAKSAYVTAKAQHEQQVWLIRQKRGKLAQAFEKYQKRNRAEITISSSDSDEEEESDDPQEVIDELQAHVAMLRTTIRLLCEKYGEELPNGI